MSTVRNSPLKKSFLNDQYAVGHSPFSPDEKYYRVVSDMPGGKGTTDIFRVQINAGDSPETPIYSGDHIGIEERGFFSSKDIEGNLSYSPCGQVDLGGRVVLFTSL